MEFPEEGDYRKELEIYRGLEKKPAEREEFLEAAKRRDYPPEELKNYKKHVGLPTEKFSIENIKPFIIDQFIPKQYTWLDCFFDLLIMGGIYLISDGLVKIIGDVDPILPAYIESTVGCIPAFIGAIGRYCSAFNKVYHHPRNHYLKKLTEAEERLNAEERIKGGGRTFYKYFSWI